MTEQERRIEKLEDRFHWVDKRQETFEEFTRANILYLKETMADNRKYMEQLDSKFNNLMVAGGIGVLTIIVTILLSK